MDEGQDTMIPNLKSQYGITDRAIVDTADALMAVKKLVYDDKTLTMAELMDALDSNFQGPRGEEIRRLCLAAPKFGNDIDAVDRLTGEISRFSAETVTGYNNAPYQNFKSVREGLSWHYAAGTRRRRAAQWAPRAGAAERRVRVAHAGRRHQRSDSRAPLHPEGRVL